MRRLVRGYHLGPMVTRYQKGYIDGVITFATAILILWAIDVLT